MADYVPYEIRCVKKDIANKEARGDDATYERWLLQQWSKYPGWEDAGNLPPPPKRVSQSV